MPSPLDEITRVFDRLEALESTKCLNASRISQAARHAGGPHKDDYRRNRRLAL